MRIPIQNIFYLLCYAWDKLEERDRIKLSISDYETTLDLLARVLLNGLTELMRRGLDRAYVERTVSYAGIKGKIDFGESIVSGSFRMGRAFCVFDEFEHDVLHNQILRATLYRLILTNSLDPRLKQVARNHFESLQSITLINLKAADFSRVRLHRNNRSYSFLLRVCKLIVDCTALDQRNGRYDFKSFTDNDKAMARLFEAFVRNFYRKECEGLFQVSSDEIRWVAKPISERSLQLLPKMRTDVTLRSDTRKLIVDTKFYSNTLSEYYGVQKFHADNLYQLFSYLNNLQQSSDDVLNSSCEGMLLYPRVAEQVDESLIIGHHKVRIATVNLDDDWRAIHDRLLQLVTT